MYNVFQYGKNKHNEEAKQICTKKCKSIIISHRYKTEEILNSNKRKPLYQAYTQNPTTRVKSTSIKFPAFRFANRKISEDIPYLKTLDLTPLKVNAIFHKFRDSVKSKNLAGEFRYKPHNDVERIDEYIRNNGLDMLKVY